MLAAPFPPGEDAEKARRMPRCSPLLLAAVAAACLAHQAVIASPQQSQQDGLGLEYAPMWGWQLPAVAAAGDDRRGSTGSVQYNGVQPQSQQQSPAGSAGIQYSTAPRQQQPQQQQQQPPQQQLSRPGTLQYSGPAQHPQQHSLGDAAAGVSAPGRAPGQQYGVAPGRYGQPDSSAGTSAGAQASRPGRQPEGGQLQTGAAGRQPSQLPVQYPSPPWPATQQAPQQQGLPQPGQPGQPGHHQAAGHLHLGAALGQPVPQRGQDQVDGSPGGVASALLSLLHSKAALVGSAVQGGVRAVLWLPGVILDALRGVRTTAASTRR